MSNTKSFIRIYFFPRDALNNITNKYILFNAFSFSNFHPFFLLNKTKKNCIGSTQKLSECIFFSLRTSQFEILICTVCLTFLLPEILVFFKRNNIPFCKKFQFYFTCYIFLNQYNVRTKCQTNNLNLSMDASLFYLDDWFKHFPIFIQLYFYMFIYIFTYLSIYVFILYIYVCPIFMAFSRQTSPCCVICNLRRDGFTRLIQTSLPLTPLDMPCMRSPVCNIPSYQTEVYLILRFIEPGVTLSPHVWFP